ncbi:MAG: non-canonical purine NTP pyrophosphatase, RdgB/HAM1 family [SAR86 cluster bacterium]|uniref:dITP/XTP pyrophosphatase n=1 Tax=SAR86 cluster bacterium TaxID=2030880 RepID=A0A2A4MQP8_9GAMM|nr:MAG: non-canonical purine NTP pyrophosphatase, RdgB/HAM1 family [SAR86 cluster bacterium]
MDAQKIILASGNAGKLREFQQIFQDRAVQLIPQSEFAVSEVEETGLSFVENALIKARHASEISQLAAIADDSGIEVDALKGEPGIYSARYAGVTGSGADQANNDKLIAALKDIPEAQRTARFQCVIVYMRHSRDPVPLIFQGSWEGRILLQECGVNGFGYDPLFYVPSHDCASAQLDAQVKNQISHRGIALRKFIQCWNSLP